MRYLHPSVLIGDCFDVLPTLASESIDYVCTSPPYDSMRDYDGFPLLNHERRIQLGRELFRVCKTGSVCSVVIGDETKDCAESLTSFRWAVEWADACDWRLFETVIYVRDRVPGTRLGFATEHEYVFNFVKGERPRCVNKEHLQVDTSSYGKRWKKQQRKNDKWKYSEGTFGCRETKDRGSVWYYLASCNERNPVKLQHHATMPDALANDLVRCFSREGERVLDCFAGSGTTLVSCAKYGREGVGIEISPKFAKLINRRLEIEVVEDIFAEGNE